VTAGTALQVALAYYRAWTSGDFEQAMSYVADDVVCQAPSGRHEGTEAFRAFMGPFVAGLTRAELLAAFGDDEIAVVMYDTDTVLVRGAPGAECVRVRDGRIVHMRIVFDRMPFEAARRAATAVPPYGSAP
jgi:ketosteroid isomerase-like protein